MALAIQICMPAQAERLTLRSQPSLKKERTHCLWAPIRSSRADASSWSGLAAHHAIPLHFLDANFQKSAD